MSASAHTPYLYEIDLSSEVAPAKIVRFVDSNVSVLELGSGPGSITKELKKKGCKVTALDIDPESVEINRKNCEHAFVSDFNIEDCLNVLPVGAKYDTIILADVLEHLYSPQSFLKLIKPYFHEKTTMIVSLPHSANNAIIASLLDGDFEYRDYGLLDKTHIRFFCLKNMQDLFEQQGYKIIEAEFVMTRPEHTDLASHWKNLNPETRAALESNEVGNIYQVVMKVVPESHPGENIQLVETWMEIKRKNDIKLIAFHLPQFHPTPENDEWWGKGFTEWTNVTKAEPLFPGHYQPHLPADLGFYDLRLKEARDQQIELAKQYGIDGFCYHFYWFSGRRLLNRPIDEMYEDKSSDMPYCFCWANETWSRRWDGQENEILIQQTYQPGDALNFIKDLVKYFQDPRYIRLEGKPFLIVYRPQAIANPLNTVEIWRDYCRQVGIGEIHLCAALTHGNDDYAAYGFDSGVQFPPHNLNIRNHQNMFKHFYKEHYGVAHDYAEVVDYSLNFQYKHQNVFKTVVPSWDNTPRTKDRSLILLNSGPEQYQAWLSQAIQQAKKQFPNQERFVFINAWNEWAEGCHLEPDRKYGHQFLQATAAAKVNPERAPELVYLRDRPIKIQKSKILSGFAIYPSPDIRVLLRSPIQKKPLLKAILKPFWKIYQRICYNARLWTR